MDEFKDTTGQPPPYEPWPKTNPAAPLHDLKMLPIPAQPISLRDWFAGMALQGFSRNPIRHDDYLLAKRAYGLADAMLKAREVSND